MSWPTLISFFFRGNGEIKHQDSVNTINYKEMSGDLFGIYLFSFYKAQTHVNILHQ